MKKWPKYRVLPIALFVYFVAMAVYGIVHHGGRLPDDFFLICGIEVVILVILFFVLRKKHERMNRN